MDVLQASSVLLGHEDPRCLNFLYRQQCWRKLLCMPSCPGPQKQLSSLASTGDEQRFFLNFCKCFEHAVKRSSLPGRVKQLLPRFYKVLARSNKQHLDLSRQFVNGRAMITMTAQSPGVTRHHPTPFFGTLPPGLHTTSGTRPAQSSEQRPVPLHLRGEPQASNGGHELLQKSLLPLVVLELVADEDEGLHKCTLLHLGQE